MRKIAGGIAIVLLFAGMLAYSAEATPLTGIISVQPGTNYSLVDCNQDDPICKKGMSLACKPGEPLPYCECNQEVCSPEESICPPGYKCCIRLGRWVCG
jgi:hypothetical protein